MGGTVKYFQIHQSVVQLVVVFMVNDLISAKWPAKMPLHDKAMFVDVFLVDADRSVANA